MAEPIEPELEGAWRRYLAEHPDDARGHAALAMILVSRGDAREAIVEAERSIALDPGLALPHYVLSRAASPFRADEAIREVQKAIELEPTCACCYSQLAHLELYHPRSARKPTHLAAEAGLTVQPDDPSCTSLQGIALGRMGRFEEAEAAFAKALSMAPDSAYVHSCHGRFLVRRGHLISALKSFQRASHLDPGSAYDRWCARLLGLLALLLTWFTHLSSRLGLLRIERSDDSGQSVGWTAKPDWSMGIVYSLWAMASLRLLLDLVGDLSPLWFCVPVGIAAPIGITIFHRLSGTKRKLFSILLILPIVVWLEIPILMLMDPKNISEVAKQAWPHVNQMPEFHLTRVILVFSFLASGLFLASLLLAKVIERNKPV